MNLEHLLSESVGRYRALLHLQTEVNEALKKARPDEIADLAEHLESLQRQAERVDLSLLSQLEQVGPEIAGHPLFRERLELLEECARQIGQMLPKAEAGQAMAAAELQQIRDGRTAMAGYAVGEWKRGNGVNGQA